MFFEADTEYELQSAGKMICIAALLNLGCSLIDGTSCCCRAASVGALSLYSGLFGSTTSLDNCLIQTRFDLFVFVVVLGFS